MTPVFNALLPVILIILLGFMLKRTSVFTDEAWTGFENLSYFVLFPALLIKTLALADLGGIDLMRYSGSVLFAIFSMTGIMLILYPLLTRRFNVSKASYTSLVQGATRWHGFIALSISGVLFGEEGVVYIAIIMAVIIPPLNIINVALMARLTDAESNLGNVFYKILRNPFILSCIIGITLNLTGVGIPTRLQPVFNIMGGGALGLGILTVGASLHLGHVHEHRIMVGFGTALRLLGMPLLMFFGTWLFDIDGVARTVAVIAGGVPTAASGYVLARQMGGDATLMANLITVQVMVSAITLPLIIWLSGI